MSDKSLLAKLLATENITVQKTPGIKTAMFDLKNRVLMLPIWEGISNDLEDLLLVHETGHALDTPHAEEYKKAAEEIAAKIFPDETISSQLASTVRGFLNVIEDARIDKRQKRRYPGSRKNYLIGYKELVERGFFGTNGRDINTMNFIDRLNMYFKGGNIHSNLTFSPEEKVMLKKVENAETWDEVKALTEEIYAYCKRKLEDLSNMEIDLVAGEGEEGDEYDIDGSDFDGDAENGLDADDEDGTGDGQGDSEGVNRGQGDLESKSTAGKGAGGAGATNAPRSETDESWQKKSEEIVKNENSTFVYLTMPTVNYDKAVNDYKVVLESWRKEVAGQFSHRYGYQITGETWSIARQMMTQWKVKEKETISFMVKEFEQKKAAELYARINVAKTGVIDTNKLHTYKYNDDIFRRIATIPKGKNHGFIMFLDWSGSMTSNLDATMKQLFSLCLFCKQIGVPFEVYAFRDAGADNPFTYLGKQNCIKGDRLVLRNFLSSRMNTEEMNTAMTMLWYCGTGAYINADGMGGTPLNDAIMVAPKIVEDFTNRNKLEITNVVWLTDGESNGPAGVMNETTPPEALRSNRKYFYVDPQTNKTYDYTPWGWGYTRTNTNTLLRILKDRTNCNLVGFFLYDSNNFKRVDGEFGISNGNPEAFVTARKYWTDNKYYPVKSAGYDEYYIINTSALKDTKNDLEINNTGEKKMTVKKMTAAFSKFAAKKTVNRVLLRQFVDRIATHSKKSA
jgi:uncharacterized protein YfkK (UPF0435 family)